MPLASEGLASSSSITLLTGGRAAGRPCKRRHHSPCGNGAGTLSPPVTNERVSGAVS